jgi:16S rRNA processing protein RimM
MPAEDAPSPEVAPGHVAIGRVLATHALRGEMKVEPLTTRPEYFAAGKSLWIEGVSYEVESVRPQKGLILLKLSGVASSEEVERLRGRFVSLPEEALGPLPEGEYYAYQIVGLEVYEQDGERLGKVTELFPTGSNDVYVVEGPRGRILLPAIDDVIVEMDVAGGKMVVSLMDGMLPG